MKTLVLNILRSSLFLSACGTIHSSTICFIRYTIKLTHPSNLNDATICLLLTYVLHISAKLSAITTTGLLLSEVHFCLHWQQLTWSSPREEGHWPSTSATWCVVISTHGHHVLTQLVFWEKKELHIQPFSGGFVSKNPSGLGF